MRDLRFRIIAENLVNRGTAAAERAVEGFRSKVSGTFASLRGNLAAHGARWTALGGVIGVAVGAIGVFAKRARDEVLAQIDDMEARSIEFAQRMRQFDIKFNLSRNDRTFTKTLDELKSDLERLRQTRDQIFRREDTQTRPEKGMDVLERIRNAALGAGFQTQAERTIRMLDDQITLAQAKLDFRSKELADGKNAGALEVLNSDALFNVGQSKADLEFSRALRQAGDDAGKAIEIWMDKAGDMGAELRKLEKAFDPAADNAKELSAKIVELRGALDSAESTIQGLQQKKDSTERQAALDQQASDAQVEAQKAASMARRQGLAESAFAVRERLRELALSKVSPEVEIRERQKRMDQLQGAYNRAQRPEERIRIAGLAIDEQQKIEAAIAKSKNKADVAQEAARYIGVGEFFERMYGKNTKKDPAEETAKNTADAKRLLERIAERIGLAP